MLLDVTGLVDDVIGLIFEPFPEQAASRERMITIAIRVFNFFIVSVRDIFPCDLPS